MSRGISSIIAIILLLVITIALAGTVYIFITGAITSKMSKVVSLSYASCFDHNITLAIRNDGTENITVTSGSGDIKILIDNDDKTQYFNDTKTNTNTYSIAPNHIIILLSDNNGAGYATGNHQVLIVSSSNAVSQTVRCE